MSILFLLVFHIIGLAMIAGTTVVDFLCYSQFWKQYAADKRGGKAVLAILAKFRFLFMIGFLLLLLSGIWMVALSHGLFAEQRWFMIKMGFILLILLNGMIVGRRLAMKIRARVEMDFAETHLPGSAKGNVQDNLISLKNRLRTFHIAQLLFFLCIFILSVYKFN
jgi:uncharacterized membrane protein